MKSTDGKGLHVGFTGTREGMSEYQSETFRGMIRTMLRQFDYVVLHHGDCVGADEEAHNIATEEGAVVVLHPPRNPKLRAKCRADDERKPLGYLSRNKAIVRESDVLIAAPLSEEDKSGGTWFTVRYAQSKNLPYRVIPREEH